jgi:hypothetical protein
MISTSLGHLAREAALRLIRDRYELGSEQDRLAYHKRHHTEGVVRRALKIALMMGLPEVKRVLVEVAASFHDTVQRWEPEFRPDGTVVRKRFEGDNEQASADEAVAWMQSLSGSPFSDRDCLVVRDAILATVPSWSVEFGTVFQRALTPQTHSVARAVALADLGSAGIEPALFALEADQLFVEQQLDFVQAIREAGSLSDISHDKQESYLQRYRTWLSRQVGFVRGRQALFPMEIQGLDEAATRRVTKLFSYFGRAIEYSEQNVVAAATMTFSEMVSQLLPSSFLKVA